MKELIFIFLIFVLIKKIRSEKMIEKILKVLAKIESNNNPKAFNARDGAKDFQVLATKFPEYIKKYNISPELCGAYGLYQILVSTAVSLGFDHHPTLLFDPNVNAFYAKKLLINILSKYSDLLDVFSVYNSGKPFHLAPEKSRLYAMKAVQLIQYV